MFAAAMRRSGGVLAVTKDYNRFKKKQTEHMEVTGETCGYFRGKIR